MVYSALSLMLDVCAIEGGVYAELQANKFCTVGLFDWNSAVSWCPFTPLTMGMSSLLSMFLVDFTGIRGNFLP